MAVSPAGTASVTASWSGRVPGGDGRAVRLQSATLLHSCALCYGRAPARRQFRAS
jgi:hypothetical protein